MQQTHESLAQIVMSWLLTTYKPGKEGVVHSGSLLLYDIIHSGQVQAKLGRMGQEVKLSHNMTHIS